MYLKRNKELDVISLYSGNYSAEFYLRQISKLTKLPLKTCQNILAFFEKERILKGKLDGKNKYFSLNIENIKTKSYMLRAEIKKTEDFLDKYPLFNSFLKSIKNNVLIVLFGSFAKFKADKDSDVDLLIVSNEKILPFHLLPYKVHKTVLTEELFRKAILEKETLIKEIEENHIILNNHSSYVNLRWGLNG
ncbi:nucleotidyltransferase domain-containing protein [Candidatus Pacearchaeota archaeon]|nr:nucleotidyltransferase domain-containing protein [Candidatus Pacearchaeota archaeon]